MDSFSFVEVNKKGLLAFNVRGGSFYCKFQFTESTVEQVLLPDKASPINNLKLAPIGEPEIVVGAIHARFLRFIGSGEERGMVMRFVNLSEEQIDLMNLLTTKLLKVDADEASQVKELFSRLPDK
ncbi:hypothetical protein AB833_32565 [Chromatiales bacterium (ex Bugula neritina AB1)]|nr:hypothetical protein AB833_32565 [Chromatiales bacterium (ex Bugula neritina AB1)]